MRSRLAALGAALTLSAAAASAQEVLRPVVQPAIPVGTAGIAAAAALAPAPLLLNGGALAAPLALPAPVIQAIRPVAPRTSAAPAGRGALASPRAAGAMAPAGDVAAAVSEAGKADLASGAVAERASVLDRIFDQKAAMPRDVSDPDARFLDELKAPGRVMDDRGIARTITVYGSARLADPAQAREQLAAAKAQAKAKRKDRAARSALLEAHRASEMAAFYEEARRFGRIVAERTKGRVAVVTGGGPGVMEAANRGAVEAGGPSVGYNIHLPAEQGLNPFVTPGMSYEFHDFATRKKGLRYASDALVFFPGGFGTMDELFEVLTLIQTGKLPRVPVILVGGTKFWKHVVNIHALARRGLISKQDLKLISFVDTAEEAWDRIAAGHPDRPEYN